MNGNPVYISIFNNKGGVGKTTIIWNVSYSLAEKRKKVLLVDFDPQCNLSIAMLGQKGFEKLLESNRHVTGSTIKDFVLPFILKNEISTIKTQIPSYKTGNGLLGYPGIELIPGDFWMNRFADILNVGTDVIGGSGLFRFLILKKLVETLDNNYDYVLIDLPPSFNTLVRSAIYCSDYFMVPCTPDLFSAYCVTLIGETLPLFLQDLETGKDRYMKYDRDTIIEQSGHIKFGGWIFRA